MKDQSTINMDKRIPPALAWGMALLSLAAIAWVGFSAPISLGDEVYHYRFAKQWWESGARPLYDTLIESSPYFYYAFDSDPLLGVILMGVWKLTGGPSQWTVQIVLLLFAAALYLGAWLTARDLYGMNEAYVALILVASLPFFVGYGSLLYQEIPACALTVLGLWRLVKRDYLIAGIFFALAFLCKRNTWLFIPWLAAAIFWFGRPHSIRSLLAFAVAPALLCFPELWWRAEKWHSIFYPGPAPFPFIYLKDPNTHAILSQLRIPDSMESGQIPSHLILSPEYIIMYFGLGLPPALATLPWAKNVTRQDGLLIILLCGYLIFWVAFFGDQLALRYAAPTFPLLCLIASGRLVVIKRRWVAVLAALLLAMQVVATSYVMLGKRAIHADLAEAYRVVTSSTPSDSLFLTPRYYFSEATGRAMVWIMLYNDLLDFLCGTEQTVLESITSQWRITHIFVDKDRLYSGTVKHRLGFSTVSLELLQASPRWRKVFENPAAIIFAHQ